MNYKTFLFIAILTLSVDYVNGQVIKTLAKDKKEIQSRPNVLFIVVDDLRTELGCYGNKIVQSPNIDQLAKEGIVFNRAYSQYPVCGPSRCSFLTGLSPTRTRFVAMSDKVDVEFPKLATLPKHFKDNGYYSISNGKIFHDHGNIIDGINSWSEIPWEPNPGFWVWKSPDNQKYTYKGYQYLEEYRENPGPSHEAPDVSDDAYPTGVLTTKTIQDLRRLKEMDKPFFLAVGYRKPHLPLNAPKKYWDLYNKSQFKLANNFESFNNIPKEAFNGNRELRVYNDIPDTGKISDNTWLKLIHGYYACVSYTDEQIGKILNELKGLGLKDNTIVVIMGDHGYQLTNHGMWSKHTNFYDAIHAPLILSVPGLKSGYQSNSIVEFVDIYPTLAELCGLSIPNHIQGKSFAPIIDNSLGNYEPKKAAFSRVGDGETIITANYIYTEWINKKGYTYEKMLFNLYEDPSEMNNLAGLKKYKKTEEELSKILHQHLQDVNIIEQDF
jgi:arylsulfatase A-like enzyme